jgi:hypothetical protein
VDDRTNACFGQVLETFAVGAITITRRYSCIRRDQYELRAAGPFPPALRDALVPRGAITGGPALYVLDVPGAYQLTVAPAAARALLMPRLSTDAALQRASALDVAGLLDALIAEDG